MADASNRTTYPWETCGILSCDMRARCMQPGDCQSKPPTPRIAESQWSDWDAEAAGFVFEAGVGLTIADNSGTRWLSWDETVALHEWLGRKMLEVVNG